MVFLARVVIVNLDIFNKHGVKQSYVINIYSIHKANIITFEKAHYLMNN